MFGFDVRKNNTNHLIVETDGEFVLVDDDRDRALRTMDTFIGEALEARKQLVELSSDES